MHMIAFTTTPVETLSKALVCESQGNAALERARDDHRTVRADPRAHRDASDEIKLTFEAMRQANAAGRNGATEQQINHLACLVALHAAIARATMDLRSAEAMVSAAAADRSRQQRALQALQAHEAAQPAAVRHAEGMGQGDAARAVAGATFNRVMSRPAPTVSCGPAAAL